MRHLHLIGDQLVPGAVMEVPAQAILAGAQCRSRRQLHGIGAAVEFDQHMDLVGNRALADHPQDVAVEEFEVPPGQGVELRARVLEQLEKSEQQGKVRPRVRARSLRRKSLRLIGIAHGQVEVDGSDETAPVFLCLIGIVDAEILQLARVGLHESQQVARRAFVDPDMLRIELRQNPARLAGAVAHLWERRLLVVCHAAPRFLVAHELAVGGDEHALAAVVAR
ncbi:MAG TPA: hypothetical protein PK440_17445 [Candidatus Accumulibacter phosphatis]|nr:hypothetical protein [Candidatus Accumulibacter phosphatis]